MDSFYTYLWLDYSGAPYYVGKGRGKRAFSRSSHRSSYPIDRSFIILQDHLSENDALEAEKFLISYYGRLDTGTGCLDNLCSGGRPGPVDRRVSEETKRKISEGNRGKVRSAEFRRLISIAQKGRPCSRKGTIGKISEETRAKIRAARKRQIITEEHKIKVGNFHRGKQHRLGHKITDETRIKMQLSQRARRSEENMQNQDAVKTPDVYIGLREVPNPKGIRPQQDTEPPDPKPMPGGASMNTSSSTAQMDVSNPPRADFLPKEHPLEGHFKKSPRGHFGAGIKETQN